MQNRNTIVKEAADLENNRVTDRFYEDVLKGLRAEPKRLDSKYFYDATGDKLFQDLMACEEYYPTKCELDIFSSQTAEICTTLMGQGDEFELIELGAGDAKKSSYLLKYLLDKGAQFTYMPIDISANIISYLNLSLPLALPGLKINGLNGEYFDMLKQAAERSSKRKVVLFLGSNLGNMPVANAELFCKEMRRHLSAGDMALIGIDLKKNPRTVLAAYNDSEGITRRFNLNLLERINRELNANFDTSKFDHYPTYDPETGSCKSYLISLAGQEVKIGSENIHFSKDEYIFMEISQKYTISQIRQLAAVSGFKTVSQFFDKQKWFTDVVWTAE